MGKTVKVTVELPEDILEEARRRANGDLSAYVLDGLKRQISVDQWRDERRARIEAEFSEEDEERLDEVRRWLKASSSTPEG